METKIRRIKKEEYLDAWKHVFKNKKEFDEFFETIQKIIEDETLCETSYLSEMAVLRVLKFLEQFLVIYN